MTYEAWRISYQSSEQAARAAYSGLQSTSTRLHEAAVACANAEAERDALRAELDALRAWKEEIEKQEPVGVLHVGSWYGEELQDWEFEADQTACDRLNEAHQHKEASLSLYARPLPSAPSVPTALLVAVADLIAQMEIVSRVGFVDTPDDKDSCAAFCVAEGSWLELMSAVESLASALAAAPEAKP